MPRNMSTERAETRPSRKGLGLRFWNFVDRATIGPSGAADDNRRTGARV